MLKIRRAEGDDTENRTGIREKVRRKLNKRRKEIRTTIFALERQLYFVKHRCISLIILVARSTLTLLLQKMGFWGGGGGLWVEGKEVEETLNYTAYVCWPLLRSLFLFLNVK